MKVSDEMMVKLTIDGMRVYTRFSNFMEVNSFTGTEKKDIKRALKEGRAYHGGGGAFAYWKLEADRD